MTVSITLAFTATGNSHAIIGLHSVTCHPAAEVSIPPLQPSETGTMDPAHVPSKVSFSVDLHPV